VLVLVGGVGVTVVELVVGGTTTVELVIGTGATELILVTVVLIVVVEWLVEWLVVVEWVLVVEWLVDVGAASAPPASRRPTAWVAVLNFMSSRTWSSKSERAE